MDEFRYILGLILIVIMPMVITFWLVIHLGARLWRKRKPIFAYCVAGACIGIVVTICILTRNMLLGMDFGTNWFLFTIGAFIYATSWLLWRPVKRHLDFKTFAGVPEITNDPIALITDGPFALVRHPRYLMVLIGIAGWCLMSNYSGAYLMGLVSFFGLLLIIKLEERDLVMRFGDQYRAYQHQVPPLLPNWIGLKKLAAGEKP
ncbi:MAG: isoprenylcysteine carboxylmethyltransferase family protein [Pseudomonadota bacterium]